MYISRNYLFTSCISCNAEWTSSSLSMRESTDLPLFRLLVSMRTSHMSSVICVVLSLAVPRAWRCYIVGYLFVLVILIIVITRVTVLLTGCQPFSKKCSNANYYTWVFIFLYGEKLQTWDSCQNAFVIYIIMYASQFSYLCFRSISSCIPVWFKFLLIDYLLKKISIRSCR